FMRERRKVMNQIPKKALSESTILVVDDDIASQNLLERFLQMIGYKHVHAVKSGEEALRFIHSSVPNLVLLDYFLPGISGFETLRQIRQMYPKLPVIMVTAYLSRDLLEKVNEEGALDMLVKPLDLRELERQVIRKLAQ
ncbi:MAG: response regulator, partial [Candidatus Omnitrophota bacterium]